MQVQRPTINRALSKTIAILITILALAPSPAAAAIQYYRLFKVAWYQQTGNSQPTTPTNFSADVDIIFSNPGDFTSAQVTSASPSSPMTLGFLTPQFAIYSTGYASSFARDTDFPNSTTYQYGISGGSLGTQTASLSTPSTNLFPSQVPYFTGTTFDQLQGMNPANPFQFNSNGYTAPGGINSPLSFFGISRVSDGQLVFGVSGTNTDTSLVLPANTLEPETAYTVGLVYSSRIATPNAGFSGATSEVAFDLRTDLAFTTGLVPEPATNLLLALGGLTLLAWKRYRPICSSLNPERALSALASWRN